VGRDGAVTVLELVNEFMRRIEALDVAAAVELVTDDCEYDNVPIGKVVGPDGIRTVLAPMLGRCSAVEWRVLRASATDGVVFNERLDRFEMGGRWIEVPVTGVWEVTDGKISLWRDYFDLATYTNQL
jgi:limonene-1,2-epoxide hydrolase